MGEKKKIGDVLILLILLLAVAGGCWYAGSKYSGFEDKKNLEQDDKTNKIEEETTNETEKNTWKLDISALCGTKECHKNYEETINGVKYVIRIDLDDRSEYEMNKSYGTVKINDLTIEETDLSSVSEIAILDNGLIAVRQKPTYVLNDFTSYYDGTKLVESFSNYTLESYAIDSKYGYYDDCQEDQENAAYYEDVDRSQRSDIYVFEINDDKTFSKTLIGSYTGVFCSVQS